MRDARTIKMDGASIVMVDTDGDIIVIGERSPAQFGPFSARATVLVMVATIMGSMANARTSFGAMAAPYGERASLFGPENGSAADVVTNLGDSIDAAAADVRSLAVVWPGTGRTMTWAQYDAVSPL